MRTVSVCWANDTGVMLTLVRTATEVCWEWRQDWKGLRSECEVRKWGVRGGYVEEKEQQVVLEEGCWAKKKMGFKLGDSGSH